MQREQAIPVIAKITAANVTRLVARGLSGVDAGQSHPRRVCSPNPDGDGLAGLLQRPARPPSAILPEISFENLSMKKDKTPWYQLKDSETKWYHHLMHGRVLIMLVLIAIVCLLAIGVGIYSAFFSAEREHTFRRDGCLPSRKGLIVIPARLGLPS
jgi:hypothetical protein